MNVLKKNTKEEMKSKINYLDLIGACVILLALYLIPRYNIAWLLHSIGCICYAILFYQRKLYFGVLLNTIAIIIGITNSIK
ncbi:hypothetical protein LCGC14_1979050 [marine sediment metagenome]|uniref:Uncharacterized protein n=1 Tax=marine sediment metagenome TaxID=412755 RepID=A0A0F9I6F8_9ZZZZ